MRDVKRIKPIMEKLEKLWSEKCPDLRFWQLINYIMYYVPEERYGQDPFFWEEDVWNEILDRALEGSSKDK